MLKQETFVWVSRWTGNSGLKCEVFVPIIFFLHYIDDRSPEGHHGFQKKQKTPNFSVLELDQKRTDFKKLG